MYGVLSQPLLHFKICLKTVKYYAIYVLIMTDYVLEAICVLNYAGHEKFYVH